MTRFLGELVFNHDRMIVAIKVAEIAIAVVTRQIDLAAVVTVQRAFASTLRRCTRESGDRDGPVLEESGPVTRRVVTWQAN